MRAAEANRKFDRALRACVELCLELAIQAAAHEADHRSHVEARERHLFRERRAARDARWNTRRP